MTGTWDDAALRAAFRARAESEAGAEVDTELVWNAVTGRSSAEERRRVIDRVALEPGYALAWRLAAEIAQEADVPFGSSEDETAGSASSPSRGWRPLYTLAAAAALLVGTLAIVPRLIAPTEPVYRGGSIVALTGSSRALPRDEFHLRWEAPAGARFDLRITTEELEIVDQARDLTSPEYVLPSERLASVPSGATLYWQVDARLPGGGVVQSETFLVTLE